MKSPQSSQQDQQPAPPSPEQKLLAAQQDVQRWQQVAASPNLSPRAAAWALEQARSARAEVKLRQKAAAYQAQQENPLEQGDDAALAVVLGLPLNGSPQSQPNPSPTGQQPPSTSPATSG